MPVDFNHTIVWSKGARKSPRFLAQILGRPEPSPLYHFAVVTTANGVDVGFVDAEGAIGTRHSAFLVSEPELDAVFACIWGAVPTSRTPTATRWRSSRSCLWTCCG